MNERKKEKKKSIRREMNLKSYEEVQSSIMRSTHVHDIALMLTRLRFFTIWMQTQNHFLAINSPRLTKPRFNFLTDKDRKDKGREKE